MTKLLLALVLALSALALGSISASATKVTCPTSSPPVVADKLTVSSPCPSASPTATPTATPTPTPKVVTPTPTPTPAATQAPAAAAPAPEAPVTGDGSGCCTKPVASQTSLWPMVFMILGTLALIAALVVFYRVAAHRITSRR